MPDHRQPLPPQSRRASLDAAEHSGELRTVRAALSSEAPVQRFFGRETLVHSAAAINLERAADGGLPLLVNHDDGALPIGRVGGVRLEGQVLRGDVSFSEATDAARDAYALVEDGTLRDVSIRYTIDEYETTGDDDNREIRVTRWTPLEVSVASVPADATVGLGRTHDEGAIMTETTGAPASAPTTDDTTMPGAAAPTPSASRAAGRDEGARLERARINQIRAIAANFAGNATIQDLATAAIDDGTTVEAFRSSALEGLAGATAEPLSQPVRAQDRAGTVVGGRDGRDKMARGIEAVLCERMGVSVAPAELEANPFRGHSLVDIARRVLREHGHDVEALGGERVVKAAIGMRAISPGTAAYVTSDFPAITANIATKRMFQGFEEADRTWDQIASEIQVPDFRQFNIPRLSQIQTLPTVAENAAYQNLTQADAQETATLDNKGGLISFSWQAMLADDVSAFSRTSYRLGEAAQRTVDISSWAVLTTNGLMGDGQALFSAPHANDGTDALDRDGLIAARTKLARQTDDNSIELGIRLAFVLVPIELQDPAMELQTADNLPIFVDGTSEKAGAQQKNTLRGTFETIATPRLTDTTDWYAAGPRGTHLEVAFLTGHRNPVVEQDMGWDTDALHFKVKHPHVAYALDWRGMVRNVVAGG